MSKNASNNVLLVWMGDSAEAGLYHLARGSEMHKLAHKAAGKFVNGDDLPEDHALFQLNDLLGPDQADLANTYGLMATLNEGMKIPGRRIKPHDHEGWDSVIICGFLP